MNERLVYYTFNLFDPDDASALTALAHYFVLPFGATLVYASGTPMVDDPGTTMDFMDDGAACGPTALACNTAAVPGEWISTHCGGTETPCEIAAGSEMTIDLNVIAVGVRFDCQFIFLTGESVG
jgi:hypothetical protein